MRLRHDGPARPLRGRRRGAPFLGGVAGEREHVVLGFERKLALVVEPFVDRGFASVIGRRRQAQVAEPAHKLRKVLRRRRNCRRRIERVGEPRADAVPGMNWATPCAPAGLTASVRNELSRQMSLVKYPTGSPSDLAEASRIPHRVARALSVSGPASGLTGRPLSKRTSAASAIAAPLTDLSRRRAAVRDPMRPPLRPVLHAPGFFISTALPAKAPML